MRRWINPESGSNRTSPGMAKSMPSPNKTVGGLEPQGDARVFGKETRQNTAERKLRDSDRTGQGDSALQRDLVPAHRRFGGLHAYLRYLGVTKRGRVGLRQRHQS